MSNHYVCYFCGTVLSEAAAHEFDDRILCEHCLDERTRGTLRYETFIATLQLVDEICRTAVQLYDRDMENLSWSEFVQRIDKKKKLELIAYLKTKKE